MVKFQKEHPKLCQIITSKLILQYIRFEKVKQTLNLKYNVFFEKKRLPILLFPYAKSYSHVGIGKVKSGTYG